jgi:glycerophosphoryl diester phosphodiesterase
MAHLFYSRCCSIKQAIRFAKSNHLMGIVSNVKPLLLAPQLIQTIKKSGLLLATYGIENNIVENAELQEKLGVDAIIADHVGHVSKLLKPNTFMNMETSSQVTDA